MKQIKRHQLDQHALSPQEYADIMTKRLNALNTAYEASKKSTLHFGPVSFPNNNKAWGAKTLEERKAILKERAKRHHQKTQRFFNPSLFQTSSL